MRFINQITGERVEAQEWQLKLKPGDYFVNERPIAGIIDAQGARHQFDTDSIRIYVRIDEATGRQGFWWCTAWSEWVPDGEKGIQCIVDATGTITEEEFEQARERGWK